MGVKLLVERLEWREMMNPSQAPKKVWQINRGFFELNLMVRYAENFVVGIY